ncbi:nuclear transport factor 2 family protein [Mycobacterium vicinigordonae]|uniref:Nuclear transport factor 2 family protein n=1 Tax=Mycobacterium vicinigordonae TaxID=1719132 RepID=A0A7D6E233_9MYCO|nr:nuclear transport factor 2 family protein [Mycobacterium vicinigordonae]QLL07861.1 nuclear transport factor 2 family protein [Mycobacterium vicinigordonae]
MKPLPRWLRLVRRIQRGTPAHELFAEVQSFYGRQMRLLDIHDINAHAETFAEDATFEHVPGRGQVSSRVAIADALRRWDQRSGAPVQRRHWLSVIAVVPLRSGRIETTAYLLEIRTRVGAKTEIAQSSVIHDILTRVDGQLLTQSRKVLEDRL